MTQPEGSGAPPLIEGGFINPPEDIEPRIGEPQNQGQNPDFTADYIYCNFLNLGGSLITPGGPTPTSRLWGRAMHAAGGTIPSGGGNLRLVTGWVASNTNWSSAGAPNQIIGPATLTVVDSGIQLPANFLGWGQFSVMFQAGVWTGSAATSEYLSSAFFIDPRFTSGFIYVREGYMSSLPTKNTNTFRLQWIAQVATPTASPVQMGLDFRIMSANLSVPISTIGFEAVLFPVNAIE